MEELAPALRIRIQVEQQGCDFDQFANRLGGRAPDLQPGVLFPPADRLLTDATQHQPGFGLGEVEHTARTAQRAPAQGGRDSHRSIASTADYDICHRRVSTPKNQPY